MTSLSFPSRLVEAGRRCQQEGNLPGAEANYREALRLWPDLAEAHAGLGILLAQQGNPAGAESCFRQAVRLEPGSAQAQSNLGIVLSQQGRQAEAESCHRQALRLQPDFAAGHNNLGLTLVAQGRLAEAEASFREALRLRPAFAEAHYNLGLALRQRGQLAEAQGCCQQALRIRPDFADAHSSLGLLFQEQGNLEEAAACQRRALELRPDYAEAHSNLGNILRDQGKLEEAAACQRQALRLRPNLADVYTNLGTVLQEQGHLEKAAVCYRQALRLKPDFAVALNNLGYVLAALGSLEEGIICLQEAVRLKSDCAEAHNNLGIALQKKGRLAEALACYNQAVQLSPGYAEAHWNQAIIWLLTGSFAQGWLAYEWRWKTRFFTPCSFSQPSWDGSPLAGRTILLHSEQGLGDTLQFIRYAPLVQQRGGRVIVLCQDSLVHLLANFPGVAQVVGQDSPLPAFEVQAALLSLPGLLGTTLETIPASVPYLTVPTELIEQGRQHLSRAGLFYVGIVWQGNPGNPNDACRSVPLVAFEPLARVEGVNLVSLQLGAGAEQLDTLGGRFAVQDVGSRLSGDWAETAAVLQNLDLVISVDTALAHCAGALGMPVWLALPFAPDWRWLLGRPDSPWYPTMRLFRQNEPGDWQSVFAAMEIALRQHLASGVPRGTRPPACREARWLEPGPAEAHNNLGIALAGQNKLAEAEACFREAVRLSPNYPDAHNNLGVVLQEQGRLPEAEVCHRQALRLLPTYVEAHSGLGIALAGQNKLEEAEACLREVVRIRPSSTDAFTHLGTVLRKRGELEEAAACHRQALRLQPNLAGIHNNLGIVLLDQGRSVEALACFDRALQLNPGYADAHTNRALAWLLTGSFAQGWPEYEWRWKTKQLPPRSFPQPCWDGSPLDGQTILLYAEGGLGDTLHFIRYAPLVKNRGGTVLVACQQPLLRILETCAGIDRLVAQDSKLPPFDVQASLLSLPGLFGTTLATIPCQVPYLFANTKLVEHWRQELADIQAFKVGIAWQGGPQTPHDRQRSVALAHFGQLVRLDGVQLISLQKGPGASQMSTLAEPFPLKDLSGRLTDFLDTAAVMKSLELVITVDTAVAHLAGALGAAVWVALPFAPDWRWLLERPDSPWYPTMRLFRQDTPGDWSGVFARIETALREHLGTEASRKDRPPT